MKVPFPKGLEREPNSVLRIERFLEWAALNLGDKTPVLVGGGAVSFYTRGAYMSSDMDFVAPDPRPFLELLEETGFECSERYRILRDLYVEVPSEVLAGRYEDRGGLRVVSAEDLIVDRLCAAKFWRSEKDRQWAGVLLSSPDLDWTYLRLRAEQEDVADLLHSWKASANLPGSKGCETIKMETITFREIYRRKNAPREEPGPGGPMTGPAWDDEQFRMMCERMRSLPPRKADERKRTAP